MSVCSEALGDKRLRQAAGTITIWTSVRTSVVDSAPQWSTRPKTGSALSSDGPHSNQIASL